VIPARRLEAAGLGFAPLVWLLGAGLEGLPVTVAFLLVGAAPPQFGPNRGSTLAILRVAFGAGAALQPAKAAKGKSKKATAKSPRISRPGTLISADGLILLRETCFMVVSFSLTILRGSENGLDGRKTSFRESHRLGVFYQTGSHYVSEYVTTQQKCRWTGSLKLQFSRCNDSTGLQVDQRSRTAVFLP
jgi:hypothetical protein